MLKTTTRLLLLTGLLAIVASGCDGANGHGNGRGAEPPPPGDPIASPDGPGRVPCALRPPPLR